MTRVSKLSVGSWALYDLANTIFSLNIISLYFSLWIVNDLGGRDSEFGIASSMAMLGVLVTAPFLGALSDQTGKRMPYLIVTTAICVALTPFLGTTDRGLALLLFVIAVYAYEAGVIFYDALLPSVSTEANRGRVGGFGIGIGYLGSYVGLAIGAITIARMGSFEAKPAIFKLTALAFLVFALPCFFFVKEKGRADATRFGWRSIKGAALQFPKTISLARRYPGLPRFLIGRAFYTDAANTIGVFMGVYLTNEIGFTEQQVNLALAIGITAAVLGGISIGFVVDRMGPRRTLHGLLGLWTFTVVLAVAVALWLPSQLFWAVPPLYGFSLGGTWASDRPYLLRLAPPRYLGQFFGIYSMVGRFSAVLGPLIWSLIVDGLGLGRTPAVAFLGLMMVVAYLILRPISDAPRVWGPDDLVPEFSVEVLVTNRPPGRV